MERHRRGWTQLLLGTQKKVSYLISLHRSENLHALCILASRSRESDERQAATLQSGPLDLAGWHTDDNGDLYKFSSFASDELGTPQDVAKENVLLQDQEEVQRTR